jgi:hypothetical protein
MMQSETLVNLEQARHILGGEKPLSRTYMWAVKRAMIQAGQPIGRKFFLSQMRQFIATHPDITCKSQRGEDSFLREVLDVLKNPRADRRESMIARLEERLQSA